MVLFCLQRLARSEKKSLHPIFVFAIEVHPLGLEYDDLPSYVLNSDWANRRNQPAMRTNFREAVT